MTITLRPMLPADAQNLAELFKLSVINLGEEDYSEEQLAAWAERAEMASFDTQLAAQLTLLAMKNGHVAGFASLKGKDTLTMLYVHPNFARQGVATALVEALERLAAARGAATLTVDASETAYPLFLKREYLAMQRNSVPLGDVWIANTTMVKKLTPPASGTLQ